MFYYILAAILGFFVGILLIVLILFYLDRGVDKIMDWTAKFKGLKNREKKNNKEDL